MKRLRVVSGIVAALLLAASLAVSFLLPSPVDVARTYCAGKGFPIEKLGLLGFQGSISPFARRLTVEFEVKGVNPPIRLVVELNQPAYFLPWRSVELHEVRQE